MSFLSFALFYLIATSSTNCITSAEDYAGEVVIPKYDLSPLLVLADRSNGVYFKTAEYSPKLLALFKETGNPNGISIRIQIPTEINEVEEPHIKFVSQSATGRVRSNLPSGFSGWRIQCDNDECLFDKDLLVVTASKRDNEVFVEINQKLQTCTSACSGACIDTQKGQKCIDNRMTSDLDRILQSTNVSNDFRSLLFSYRTVGSESILLTDVVPIENEGVDWQEALKQELVYLTSQKVISLSKDEIETISSMARKGQSGEKYRIVWDSNSESSGWKYANQVDTIIPSQERDCTAYSLPSQSPLGESPVELYYIVPFTILGIGCAVLLILILVARIITRPKRKTQG